MSLFLSRDEAMRRAEELVHILGIRFEPGKPAPTWAELREQRRQVRAWLKRAEEGR